MQKYYVFRLIITRVEAEQKVGTHVKYETIKQAPAVAGTR